MQVPLRSRPFSPSTPPFIIRTISLSSQERAKDTWLSNRHFHLWRVIEFRGQVSNTGKVLCLSLLSNAQSDNLNVIPQAIWQCLNPAKYFKKNRSFHVGFLWVSEWVFYPQQFELINCQSSTTTSPDEWALLGASFYWGFVLTRPRMWPRVLFQQSICKIAVYIGVKVKAATFDPQELESLRAETSCNQM